jgi:hypothetical protein
MPDSHAQSRATRGLGVSLPVAPPRSGLPALDRAYVELALLHSLIRSLVDRVIATYTMAMKEEKANEKNEPASRTPDPVNGLVEWLAPALDQIDQQRARVIRTMRRLDRALDRLGHAVPARVEARPVLAKRAEVDRLRRGLPFAEAWILLAVHQFVPLAVARTLRCRVWPKHIGARMASVLIAQRALVTPWGPIQSQTDLPLSEFPLDAYGAVWGEVWHEAVKAVRRTLRVAEWLRDRILRREGSRERPENNRDLVSSQRDILTSALYEQISETSRDRWGDRTLHELDRLARDGRLNVGSRAILDDLLDQFGSSRDRRRIPCPFCHKGQVRPPAKCPVCETWISKRRRPRRGREGVVEEVGATATRILDRVSRVTRDQPERAIEILIQERRPDEMVEDKQERTWTTRLLADPRATRMLRAMEAGARTQKEIAAHCRVSDKTVRRWEEDLRSKYKRYFA